MASNPALWATLKAKLPHDKTPEQLAQRDQMWHAIDPNHNGLVSVAEAHAYCKNVLGLEALTPNLQPIVLRAHNAAKQIRTHTKPSAAHLGDEYVERSEFRVFLQYLYNYFELYAMFSAMDKDGNRKLTLAEFKNAVPMIKEWGMDISAPGEAEKMFHQVDTNHGGEILFDEFVEFAAHHQLDLDHDTSNSSSMEAMVKDSHHSH